MKKLFVFDIDGTLLNSSLEINDSTIKGLKKLKQQNHYLMIATGRSYTDAIFALKHHETLFDFILCNNGGYLVDYRHDQTTVIQTIPNQTIAQILALVSNYNLELVAHFNQSELRTLNFDQATNALTEIELNRYNYVTSDVFKQTIANQAITQFSMRAQASIISELYPLIKKNIPHISSVIGGKVYIDINPQGMSKAKGIEVIVQNYQLAWEDIIAFGDSDNDLQMLRTVGLGICMGNGTKEAKNAAKQIIGNHNSDAIYDKIIELIKP